MKKIILSTLLFTLILSCDKMNDIHKEYLNQGEIIYLGIPYSLNAYSGLERVKLTWMQSSDPDITETVIYWNRKSDSIVKPFNRNISGNQKDSIIIENLPEGDYIFELMNRNGQGNTSLISTVQGSSLGDFYLEGLKTPQITSIKVNEYNVDTKSATVELQWLENSESVGTILRYNKYPSGEPVEIHLTPGITSLILPDVGNRLWKTDDMIYLASRYALEAAIDTFTSSYSENQIVTYTVTLGYRQDISATGVPGDKTSYGIESPAQDVIDKHFWLSTHDKKILWCDRFGSFAMATDFANFQYRLTLREDNTFEINGASFVGTPPSLSYSIKNTDIASTYDPETGRIYLNNMRVLSSTGALTYFEEELIPK